MHGAASSAAPACSTPARRSAARFPAARRRRTRTAWSSTTAPISTTISSPPTRPRSSSSTRSWAGIFQRTGLYFYAYLNPRGRAARRAIGVPLLCERRRADQLALLLGERRRVSVRAAELGRASGISKRQAPSTSRCPTRRPLSGEHAAGVPVLRQPARRQPPLHGRPVGAARDAQPRLGPRGRTRRRVLFADLATWPKHVALRASRFGPKKSAQKARGGPRFLRSNCNEARRSRSAARTLSSAHMRRECPRRLLRRSQAVTWHVRATERRAQRA